MTTQYRVCCHLGDGAYINIDNDIAILTANHHDPQYASDVVYLESFALRELIKVLDIYEQSKNTSAKSR